MKVTLDTNVLVSGTFWSGESFRIFELVDKKKVICVLSKDILGEYRRVLEGDEIVEKVEGKGLITSKVVERVIVNSRIVEPKVRLHAVREDEADNRVLECAKAGGVDFVVSYDEHLLKLGDFKGIPIVKPAVFLKRFQVK